jgi:Rps23 Pro-64 3,4-dihydroxylase Tpa1-like proline 4-hydroxylase
MSTPPLFDFSKTSLANDYTSGTFYLKIIDDVFTPDECRALIHFAETGLFLPTHRQRPSPSSASSPAQAAPAAVSKNPWRPAAIDVGMGQQVVDKLTRDSDRILRFDNEVAAFLFQRLAPYVPEIIEIRPGDEWHRMVGRRSQQLWRMVGVNERLSFLKYGPGHFFQKHMDGQIELRDGRKARATLQVYLNGDNAADKIVGGSTRIWSHDHERFYDVEPRAGRVLIFQQAMVLHSGEEVKRGVKYTLRSDFMYRTEDCNAMMDVDD